MGRVAGLASPALLDLLVVSINSGTNFLLGLGVSSAGESSGIETGVGSGVGNGLAFCLLLLNVVSTGSGTKRLFAGAKSLFSTASSCSTWLWSFLLVRIVVSTGSTANRRTFLTVVSTGVGEKRLEDGGGGEVSVIVPHELGE